MTIKFLKNQHLKKTFFFLLLLASNFSFAQEKTSPTFKFYGFVRNDFFYNSRQNVEAIDGAFHIYPKPVSLVDGIDVNAKPQAELLSIASRIGVDVKGGEMLGAKSFAKIEADFAGFGANFYVLRIRQAYAKLNWEKSELLLGQTWHPLFGNVMPTTMSLNAGSPFQAFNRSPQLRFKQNITSTLSVTAVALYQMQYTSQGPLGSSTSYLKNALTPNLFLGIENKTTHWTTGIGADMKTIKVENVKNTSFTAVAYAQYASSKLQIKGKALLGQNLSDQLMLSGYGVSGVNSDGKVTDYTNFNVATSWVNVVYGKTWRVGLFAGLSQNLGTSENLTEMALSSDGLQRGYLAYGYGFYKNEQLLLDRLYRITPHVSYNLPKLTFGLEYDFTSANYGTLLYDGKISNSQLANNHRIVASVSYFF